MAALSSVARRFVLHWGEMGSRWGINRSVAQIHALLYVTGRPLPADEIADVLQVARSNVSNSLRELQAWNIVHVVHVMGDRRDHFESLRDVWEMFQIVLDERKRREIDPTVALLRQCLADEPRGRDDREAQGRLRELLGFFETMSRWYEQVRRLPTGAVMRFVRMGDKLGRWLGKSA